MPPSRFVRHTAMPLDWNDQRKVFGFRWAVDQIMCS